MNTVHLVTIARRHPCLRCGQPGPCNYSFQLEQIEQVPSVVELVD